MSQPVRLTQRELDVMSILWRRKHATVAEIRDDLSDDLAYPTVQTILRVLEGKGYVDHIQDGRAFVFRPLVHRDEAADGVLRRLVSKVYHGSRERLVTQLLADEDISADELKRIRKVLQDRMKRLEED